MPIAWRRRNPVMKYGIHADSELAGCGWAVHSTEGAPLGWSVGQKRCRPSAKSGRFKSLPT